MMRFSSSSNLLLNPIGLDVSFVDQDLVARAVGIAIVDLSDRCYNFPVPWLAQAFLSESIVWNALAK